MNFRIASIGMAGAACLLAACTAAQPKAKTAAPPPAPAAAAEDTASFAPPDGKWLTDEQGRQYFVREIPKVEGQYFKPAPGILRLGRGETYEIEAEDETTFRVKIYRIEPPAQPESTAKAEKAEQAEKAAVAATYRSEAGVSNRWRVEEFGRGLPQRGQWREGFVVVDFDGDGNLDIVHGPPRKGSPVPVVFLGDGHGNWRQQSLKVSRPGGYDYGDVAVADFNRDGRLDVALGIHLRGLMVLVAAADGTYQEWSRGIEYSLPGEGSGPAGFSSRAVAAVDWNGDGWTDVVALGEGPRLATSPSAAELQRSARPFGLAIFENRGDGSWVPHLEAGVRAYGDALEAGDLDGDGRPDAVLGSSVLSSADLLRYGAGGSAANAVPIETRPRSYSQAIRMADLNADGRKDLVVGYVGAEQGTWRYGVDLYLAKPEARTFERRPLFAEEGRWALAALAAGDADGDGRTDVVALDAAGRTWLFRGNEKGSFDREKGAEPPIMEGCRGYHVELADLDHDGAAEIVAEFAGEPNAFLGTPKCPSQGAIRAWKVVSAGGPGAH